MAVLSSIDKLPASATRFLHETKFVPRLCLTTIVLVFAVAAGAKIYSADTLMAAINASLIVPQSLTFIVAYALIAAEIMVVIGCFVKPVRRYAIGLALFLSFLFLSYSIWRIYSKIDESCGCFGTLFVLKPVQSVFLNTALIAASGFLLMQGKATSPAVDTSTDTKKRTTGRHFLDVAIVTVTVIGTSYFFMSTLNAVKESRSLGAPIPLKADISAASITGTSGFSAIPYTLVEFGDYQCPYCRDSQPYLQKLLSEHPKELHFVFRHMPLTKIHPLAQLASEVSVAAKEKGEFATMHRLLMQQELDKEKLLRLQKTYGVSPSYCAAEIRRDVELAQALEIRRAPTFLLCNRNGDTYQLDSLGQVEVLLNNAH